MSYPYNNYNNPGGYAPQGTWVPQRSEMSAGYQQYQQLPTGRNDMQVGFSCRPVTSRLEAEAVQVDYVGPGTLMPDLAHGVVYLKRFNRDTGASDFLEFVFRPAQPEPEPPKYATMADLNALWAEVSKLKERAPQEVSRDDA